MYKGYAKEGAEFTLIKKGYSQNYSFGFDIRYFPAYQGFNGTRGGASVFRPATSESLNYCAPSANSTSYFMEGEAASQLTLEFDCPENTKAMVKVRLYANDPVIEWDVKTDSIGVADGHGKDVVLNFFTKDVDNKGIFYTDSNGLEMQKRELSFKDIQKASPSDISANFYPITSAIVIRDADTKRHNQMILMTSRTQGGSSLKSGHIELVHSRRMLFDDRESQEIVLNDTDIN